jgi:hypothetical protein
VQSEWCRVQGFGCRVLTVTLFLVGCQRVALGPIACAHLHNHGAHAREERRVSGLVYGLRFRVRDLCSGFRVSGFGFRASGIGVRVPGFGSSGFGCRISGWELRISGAGFRVEDFGCKVTGFGFRVQGEGLRISGAG